MKTIINRHVELRDVAIPDWLQPVAAVIWDIRRALSLDDATLAIANNHHIATLHTPDGSRRVNYYAARWVIDTSKEQPNDDPMDTRKRAAAKRG